MGSNLAVLWKTLIEKGARLFQCSECRVGVARLHRLAGISNLVSGAFGSCALPYVGQSILKTNLLLKEVIESQLPSVLQVILRIYLQFTVSGNERAFLYFERAGDRIDEERKLAFALRVFIRRPLDLPSANQGHTR